MLTKKDDVIALCNAAIRVGGKVYGSQASIDALFTTAITNKEMINMSQMHPHPECRQGEVVIVLHPEP